MFFLCPKASNGSQLMQSRSPLPSVSLHHFSVLNSSCHPFTHFPPDISPICLFFIFKHITHPPALLSWHESVPFLQSFFLQFPPIKLPSLLQIHVYMLPLPFGLPEAFNFKLCSAPYTILCSYSPPPFGVLITF